MNGEIKLVHVLQSDGSVCMSPGSAVSLPAFSIATAAENGSKHNWSYLP